MNIAQYIDHTALKPVSTKEDIDKLCQEAIQYQFAAVCVPPFYVAQSSAILNNSKIKVATVIGFPFGYSSIGAKTEEIKQAIKDGTDDIDLVINLCAVKNNDWDYLSREIVSCLQPVRLNRKVIKVIIETGVLLDEEIVACCNLYARHKVDFMKTSTGYAEKGASVQAVTLMKEHLPAEIAIKASGGIRTFAFAKELIDAGATRIGASASMNILTH